MRYITIMVIVLGGLVTGLLGAACGAADATPTVLTEQDAGRTVTLRLGARLIVRLTGNPTTGYQWTHMAGDPAILRPVGEPAFTPDTGALGSSGKVQVTYEAMARGQTALQLGYRRPFEPNVPPRATFEVTVVVQ